MTNEGTPIPTGQKEKQKARRFGLHAACTASGATQTNIRYWNEKGYLVYPIEPAGRGKTRGYTLENIYEFSILKYAATSGIPHAVVREVLKSRPLSLLRNHDPVLLYTPATDEFSIHERFRVSSMDLVETPTVIIVNLNLIMDLVDWWIDHIP